MNHLTVKETEIWRHGRLRGEATGRSDGYKQGLKDGRERGETAGYRQGFIDGVQEERGRALFTHWVRYAGIALVSGIVGVILGHWI